MRLLLVEDDPKIATFVSKGLTQEGFVVDHAGDGLVGLSLALHTAYDAAVIDLMLPGLDGLSLIDELRQRRIKVPVIILSARRSVDERVAGLQAGGGRHPTKAVAISEPAAP